MLTCLDWYSVCHQVIQCIQLILDSKMINQLFLTSVNFSFKRTVTVNLLWVLCSVEFSSIYSKLIVLMVCTVGGQATVSEW